jgi:hypothetical protein
LVKLKKLGFLAHLLVTYRAGKVVDTPSLVEGTEHISINDIVAHKADVAK